MPRDEHGKLLVDKFAGTANPAENAALGSFPFSEGWDENYWPPGTSTISGPVVNAILRRISAVGVEINLNGVLEWDTSISYNDNAIVLGSDGVLYQSQQASNSAHNPTTDTSNTYWAPLPDRYLATVAEAQAGTDPDKLMAPLTVRAAVTALLASVAEAQAGTDPAKLMTPLRVRQAITEILATAAQARAGNDNDVLMTPLRVQDAVTALLASVAEAQAGTDPAKLMTPLRVRQSITEILATAAQARTGTDPTRLMTPERVRESITAILATQAEAEAGSAPDKLMTPLRVKNYIDRNPASVSRHDSPVITLDAATGTVVNTSSTLGSSVAKAFQPLLVAARARGGYSVNDEVAVGYQLADGVDVKIRKVNNTSFAVHCPSGDVTVPVIRDYHGIYFFEASAGQDVYRTRSATGWASAADLGYNTTQGITAATYWGDGSDQRIIVLDHSVKLHEIRNPLRPDQMTEIGGAGNGRLPAALRGNAYALAAHRVNGELRLYAIGRTSSSSSSSISGLFRINPDNPGDTTSPYGKVAGNLPLGSGTGIRFRGMTSHGGQLYAIRRTGSTNDDYFFQIDVNNAANSRQWGGEQLTVQTLFSADGKLFGVSDESQHTPNRRVVWEYTTFTSSSVLRTNRGQLPAGMAYPAGAAVIPYRSTQTMSVGNGSAVDWNLKIRYAA